ncbi:MAG TPA: hypothetical protein DIT89_11520 [Planctomycetaceae bacterium]|nr:hypothetical protein [Planctomycetaceae bacterium]
MNQDLNVAAITTIQYEEKPRCQHAGKPSNDRSATAITGPQTAICRVSKIPGMRTVTAFKASEPDYFNGLDLSAFGRIC